MNYESVPTEQLQSELADIDRRIKQNMNTYGKESLVQILKDRRDKIRVELRKRDNL